MYMKMRTSAGVAEGVKSRRIDAIAPDMYCVFS